MMTKVYVVCGLVRGVLAWGFCAASRDIQSTLRHCNGRKYRDLRACMCQQRDFSIRSCYGAKRLSCISAVVHATNAKHRILRVQLLNVVPSILSIGPGCTSTNVTHKIRESVLNFLWSVQFQIDISQQIWGTSF